MKFKRLLSLCLAAVMLFGSAVMIPQDFSVEASSSPISEQSEYILPDGGDEPIQIFDLDTLPQNESISSAESVTSDINVSASESLFRRTQSKYMYSCLKKYKNGAKMQKLYNDIMSKMEALWYSTSTWKNNVSFRFNDYGVSHEEFMDTYYVFFDANPMMFFASRWSYHFLGNDRIEISIDMAYKSSSVRRSWDKKIKNYINSFSSALKGKNTLYHKALALHDTLIHKTTYAFVPGTTTPEGASWAHDITGAVTKNSAVCEGYSRVYQLLVNYYGGDCTISSGSTFNWQLHAWNIVKFDDNNYYYVDTTWDDPISVNPDNLIHYYFAVGKTYFSKTHKDSHDKTADKVPDYSLSASSSYPLPYVPSGNFNTKIFVKHTHLYTPKVVAPNCTTKGYTLHTCKICGKNYKDNYKAATGHKFGEWKITKAATKNSKGTMTRKCSGCSETETKKYVYYERIAGANRYETASFISRGMYKSADTVIIATGLTFRDAMVAVPLAKAYNAPLLLTTDKQVTKYTEERLKKLNAKKVIIVSTGDAVGSKVTSALAKYDPTVISGKTCFETASKVAKALQTKTKKAPDTIFFATDGAFADALSASPVAAIKGAPIIYLNNKSIDKTVADYLKSVKGTIKNAYIIGGEGVISNAMMKNVAKALGLTSGKTVQRVAGANRYETCVAVNKKFKSVLNSDGICVAKGLDFPDALAGGVFAANQKAPLLLADSALRDAHKSFLKDKKPNKLYIFGGTVAVPDKLAKEVAKMSV